MKSETRYGILRRGNPALWIVRTRDDVEAEIQYLITVLGST
jgi:hypothetical protein